MTEPSKAEDNASLLTFEPDNFDELPQYAPAEPWDVPQVASEYSFHLSQKKATTPWLTLTVKSRAASDSEPPIFYQGGDVGGKLLVSLEKEERVDDVTIEVSFNKFTSVRRLDCPLDFS